MTSSESPTCWEYPWGLRHSNHEKILWAVVILGLAFLLVYGVGFYFMYRDIARLSASSRAAQLLEPVNFFVIAALYGVDFLVVMPSEAMWKRAAYLMQPPFLRELGLDATPFGAASAPSEAMVVYAVIYSAVALALAIRWFSKRDL